MYNNTAMPYSIAMTPISDNNGFGGDGSWWVIILVLIVLFGGWGNGGFGAGNSGAARDYVLTSDFATIQRQLSDGFNGVDNALDRQNAGICDLGYTSLSLNNQTNTAIMQGTNAIQTQLADCCCTTKQLIADVNYNIATQANGITNAINTGFCQTNYNAATNTRDIIDNQNANARAILEKLNQQEMNAKDAQIAALEQRVNTMTLAASQAAQNQYIHDLVRPPITPCYLTQNPYGCNCGNAYPYYPYGGTTIA